MLARDTPLSLEIALSGLAPGSHACSIDENESEPLAVAASFVRIGLERGEQCVYITREAGDVRIQETFRAGRIDVDAALQSKSLVLLTPRQAGLKGDAGDPYRMFMFWKKLASSARVAGFSSLRGTVDMECILGPGAEERQWLEYEQQLTQLAEETRSLLLCQYQRSGSTAEHMLNVVRSHPCVIHRGTLAQNIIYHVASVETGGEDPQASMLESLLGDIRKREQVEHFLSLRRNEEQDRSEQRLKVALASSTVAFTILRAVRDEAGRIVDFSWQYANPEAARVIGRLATDLIGRRLRDVLPNAWDSPGLFESYVQVVETGKQATIEAGFTRDGIWSDWQNVVTRLEDGVAVWFPEITERKRAEEELRRSEAYLADGQRISHTGSWGWDAASREISFWSLEHFRIVGLDPAVTPTYAKFRPLVHPDDLAFIEENFARAVRERVEFEHDFRIIRSDGRLRYLRSYGHPVFDDSGTLIEYAGTIIDRTAEVDAEAALRTTQAQLARVARLMTLGELTASIAHEVNQPLAAILAYGAAVRRWLRAEPPNVHEADAASAGIVDSARRAREVIARIRSLAGKADGRREVLDINNVMEEVIALAQGELLQSNVSLRTELASALPPIFGDRVQLQQVALNLIMNAVEAMSSLTQRPRELFIRTWNTPEALHVAVRDSGIGVPEDTMQAIFEPFYTTKRQGIGIGLSISRSIIQAHNGQLWIEPNEGMPGVTVHFTFP